LCLSLGLGLPRRSGTDKLDMNSHSYDGWSSQHTEQPPLAGAFADSWPSCATLNFPCAPGLVMPSWSCCKDAISGSPGDLSFASHLGCRAPRLQHHLSTWGRCSPAATPSSQHYPRPRNPACPLSLSSSLPRRTGGFPMTTTALAPAAAAGLLVSVGNESRDLLLTLGWTSLTLSEPLDVLNQRCRKLHAQGAQASIVPHAPHIGQPLSWLEMRSAKSPPPAVDS
jgi:hypothetical protein